MSSIQYKLLFLTFLVFLAALLWSGCNSVDLTSTDQAAKRADGGYSFTPAFPDENIQAEAGTPAIASSASGFFPLAIGSRWHYSGEIEFDAFMSGAAAPAASFVIHTEEERRLVGKEDLFGREYVVEERLLREDIRTDTITWWARYRQDRSGLYLADVALVQPPQLTSGPAQARIKLKNDSKRRWNSAWASISPKIDGERRPAFLRAWRRLQRRWETLQGLFAEGHEISNRPGRPGGVLPDEITRLEYPLHPGAQWIIRDDPFFGSVVEGMEVLDLAPGRMAGFRIRVISDFFGPNDVVLLWYGRDGFLGLFAHLESEATDVDGNPLGLLVFEESHFLEEFTLVRFNN